MSHVIDGIFCPFQGKSPNGLLMSDATSLLLRLEMEGGCKTQDGTDLKARWRELGEYLKNFHADKVGTNFFYDIHVLIGLLLDEHFCRLPPDIAHPKIAPKILSPDTECSAWNRFDHYDEDFAHLPN